jgi:hypothetical protein
MDEESEYGEINPATAEFIERWRGDMKVYVAVMDYAYDQISVDIEIEGVQLGREVVERGFVSLEGIDLAQVDLETLGDVIHDEVRRKVRRW